MKISDYDILKRFGADNDLGEFLREHGEGKAVPLLMHHLSEYCGYAQYEAFRMAKTLIQKVQDK